MNTQDPHSTPEELQEEHTMKKTTQAAVLSVKMNDQFQINAAVNYWNSEKSWVEILRDTGFAYRTETREWGLKIIVHHQDDEEDVYGIAKDVFFGEPSNKMINIPEYMMETLHTGGESSIDKEKFFAEQIFFGDYEKLLKKEIIPFYERHLRDLAAEESTADAAEDVDDVIENTPENTTIKKGANTMSRDFEPKFNDITGDTEEGDGSAEKVIVEIYGKDLKPVVCRKDQLCEVIKDFIPERITRFPDWRQDDILREFEDALVRGDKKTIEEISDKLDVMLFHLPIHFYEYPEDYAEGETIKLFRIIDGSHWEAF